jgi:hypothetical protein
MKAIATFIIATILALQVNVLFAGNDITSTPAANAIAAITLTSLTPTVPVEATFEDAIDMTDFASLAPTTPAEAQFEDINYETVTAMNLAPVTPAADFEDGIDVSSLTPAIPVEADFE